MEINEQKTFGQMSSHVIDSSKTITKTNTFFLQRLHFSHHEKEHVRGEYEKISIKMSSLLN